MTIEIPFTSIRIFFGWILSYGVLPLYAWGLPNAYGHLSGDTMALSTAIYFFIAHSFIMFCLTAVFLIKIKFRWVFINAYIMWVLLTALGMILIPEFYIIGASLGNFFGYRYVVNELINREEASREKKLNY